MKDRRNVIIITFDCLRPDRLGASGYRGVSTPTFDRIMDEGVTFTNAYCQAPNTWKSHAVMFTGCVPPTNGVRTPVSKISSQLQTMAEIFQEAGYATFGLPALSVLSEEAGFSRGFMKYNFDKMMEKTEKYSRYRTCDDTLEIANSWLERISQPFFLWVHHFGIHWLPSEFLDLPNEYRQSFSEYAQFYDGKVSYTDANFLAPLVADLQALGLFDQTILVLWSDHGDDLKDIELIREGLSKSDGHNRELSEDVMRILLTIRAPGLLPNGEKRVDVCQSIDLLPTLLDLTGIKLGSCQCQGRSLVDSSAQIDSAKVYLGNVCRGYVGIRYGRYKLILVDPSLERDQNPFVDRIQLLKNTGWQLLPYKWRQWLRGRYQKPFWSELGEPDQIFERLLDIGHCKFYDLEVDPEGKNDIAKDFPQLVSEYKKILLEIATRSVSDYSSYATPEEEAAMEEHLKSLGYF